MEQASARLAEGIAHGVRRAGGRSSARTNPFARGSARAERALPDVVRFRLNERTLLALQSLPAGRDGRMLLVDGAGQRRRLLGHQVELRLRQNPDLDNLNSWRELAAFGLRSERIARLELDVAFAWHSVRSDSPRAKRKLSLYQLARLMSPKRNALHCESEHESALYAYAALLALERDNGFHFERDSNACAADEPKFRAVPNASARRRANDAKVSQVLREIGNGTDESESHVLRRFAEELQDAVESGGCKNSIAEVFTRNCSQRTQLLNNLERYAIRGQSNSNDDQDALGATEEQAINELLSRLHLPPTPIGAHVLLIRTNRWSFHENVHICRHNVPSRFSSECTERAHWLLHQETNVPDTDGHLRIDLTGDTVLTIDSKGPNEIDDGFSARLLSDNLIRLRVHIADPTRWIKGGDALDADAQARACSIYLPEQTIPMLPEGIVQELMSLQEGSHRCSLTVEADVMVGSGAVVRTAIFPSTVQVLRNLSHEHAEDLMWATKNGSAAVTTIVTAKAATDALRAKRLSEDGGLAHFVTKPSQSASSLDKSAIVTMQPDSQHLQTAQLVEELMTLAGHVAAAYARERGLAIPFRTQRVQSQPDWEAVAQCRSDEAHAAAIRDHMGPSIISTQPGMHEALGLSEYVQISSPLRRYLDLLTHRQIKASLRGERAPLGEQEVSRCIEKQRERVANASAVTSKTSRYWAIVWFSRFLGSDKLFRAQLLKWTNGAKRATSFMSKERMFARVLIVETGYETTVPLDDGALQPGDEVWLRCVDADPAASVLRFKQEMGTGIAEQVE